MLLRGRQKGGINTGCPQCTNDDGPYAGIDAGVLLLLLPSSDKFYGPGLAYRREEEDEDNDSNDSQEKDRGKEMMMTTITTVAMGGATLKDNETRTLLQAAATAMAPPNVLSAPRPYATRERLGSLEIYSVE
jgi:hypothetical protein